HSFANIIHKNKEEWNYPMFYLQWPGCRYIIKNEEHAVQVVEQHAHKLLHLNKVETFYLDIRSNLHAMGPPQKEKQQQQQQTKRTTRQQSKQQQQQQQAVISNSNNNNQEDNDHEDNYFINVYWNPERIKQILTDGTTFSRYCNEEQHEENAFDFIDKNS